MSLMLFTHYLLGYVGTTICSIGLILALCSVYIFTRRQMRCVVSTYLTGLSISDSCLLFLGLIFAMNASIPPNKQSESFYSSHIHKYLFPYVYACIIWFQFTSVWVIVGFAIDRWFAIKWPMVHYTYSSKRALLVQYSTVLFYLVITVYCLGFIYSLPRFFEYKTEVQTEALLDYDNSTEYIYHIVIANKLQNSKVYQYTVHLILYSLLQSILPLLMLAYFNVELIRSVQASSNFVQNCGQLYKQDTGSQRQADTIRHRDGVITRSVICLIGLFIICQVPASILHYLYMFCRNQDWLYIFYDISNFLILFNSAVNFFVFAFFNRKFRRQLTQICCRTKDQNALMMNSSHRERKETSSRRRANQQERMNSTHPNQNRTNNGVALSDQPESVRSKVESHSIYKYKRTTSLRHVNSMNKKSSKCGRYSICEFRQNESPSIKYNEQKFIDFRQQKYKAKNNFNAEKFSPCPERYSLLLNSTGSNGRNSRTRKLHYVNLDRMNGKRKSCETTLSKLTTTFNRTESVEATHIQNSYLLSQHESI